MHFDACSGPRCKAIDDKSFIARAAAEMTECKENHTRESFVEQNPGKYSTIAANKNLEIGPLQSVSCPKDNGETTVGGVARKLKDPFDFHIYVGFSPQNYEVIQYVIETLKTKWNLLCCFSCSRHNADVKLEECRIKDCIARSEKCLLYVTPEYMKEPWYKAEVIAAAEKAHRFSREQQHMLFVLKDPKLCADDLNDMHLQEFGATDWPPLGDSALPNQLSSWLLQVTELAPITQMPKKISGYYEALVYYFGFLGLVLQDHRRNMKSVVESWSEVDRAGARVCLPMLIVVPESCRAPKSFHVDGKLMTSRDKYVVNSVRRAGRENRDYKMPVVTLIIDAEKNDVIYFSGEFPAILLTMYETYTSGQTGLEEDQLEGIRTDFHRTLQSLLCHPDNRHCFDQYRLVLWPDDSVDLYDFLLPIVCGAAEDRDASSLVVYGRRSDRSQLRESLLNRQQSCNYLRTLGSGSPPYVMRYISPRGIFLIINTSDVTQTFDVDVRRLRELFSEQFDFDVRVHSDQRTSDDLDSLLCGVAQEDHSRYDAFVCYIVSRGRLGIVSTSDGTCNPVVNLVNFASDKNCEQLHGKPKLFLVQTTDDGTIENEDMVSNDFETQVHSLVYAN